MMHCDEGRTDRVADQEEREKIEREKRERREIILLRSIVNMIIHVK